MGSISKWLTPRNSRILNDPHRNRSEQLELIDRCAASGLPLQKPPAVWALRLPASNLMADFQQGCPRARPSQQDTRSPDFFQGVQYLGP